MKFELKRMLFLLLVITAGMEFGIAQSTNSGDIRGTVADASGAVVPNVTVSVLNVDTGVSKDFVTNNDGIYDTSSIVTGNYMVTFSGQGFERLVRGPITIQVGNTTLNPQLKVGDYRSEIQIADWFGTRQPLYPERRFE